MSSINNIESDISTMKLFDIGKVNITNRKNLSSNYVYNYETDVDNTIGEITANVGAIDDIYIWGYLAVILIIGMILNILAIFTLFRARCNGTRYFLLQLTFCDFGSLMICGLELFYINYRKWFMLPELCPIYLGFESFINTATIYFIIAINLHAISTYNLAIKRLNKKSIESDEYDPLTISTNTSNQQQLDINNDDYEIAISTPTTIHQSTRSLTIDYSKKKNGISVIMPALFIWFIAASSAIPLIVFGQVIPNELNPKICGIMNFDWYSTYVMQGFMLMIRITLPIICLLITLIFLIIKLSDSQSERIEKCGLDENVRIILKLALGLTLVMLIFGVQRIFGSLLFELISKPFMHYRYPKMNIIMALLMSGWTFLGSVIRPIVYFSIDYELKDLYCKKKRKKRKFHKTGRN